MNRISFIAIASLITIITIEVEKVSLKPYPSYPNLPCLYFYCDAQRDQQYQTVSELYYSTVMKNNPRSPGSRLWIFTFYKDES